MVIRSSSLVQTEQVLRDLYAHTDSNYGVHTFPEQRVSAAGIDLGSLDYDPERHEAHMIDPLSAMQDVFDVPQVHVQLPFRPIVASVITDRRIEDVNPRIAESKLLAIDSIGGALVKVMPPLDFVKVAEIDFGSTDEADERDAVRLANEGLGIIVSDFSRFNLGPKTFSGRSDVLAVKVNHPIELEVPAGVGRLVLGGVLEINTDNPNELEAYNHDLSNYHASINERIRQSGAVCVQVVTDASVGHRFDSVLADTELASAISSFSK